MKPSAKDNGSSYHVKVKNDLGEASSNKGFLNISSGPVFLSEPFDRNALKEKEAKFECIIKGNPRPTVTWFFGDKELANRENVRIDVDKGKDKYILLITRVLPAICGTYKVRAINEFGMIEKDVQLKITELPKIVTKLENLIANEGESAKFSVKVSGVDRPPYKWYRDDYEIKAGDDYEINEQDDEITLLIKSCKSKNAGNHYLKFHNDFGDVESNKATLTINRAPKFVHKPKNTIAIQDQPIKIDCLVDAHPKAKLTWIVNGKELTGKDNVKFEIDPKTNSNLLVIPKVNAAAHLGKYTVKATNVVGSVEETFELDVLEPPKVSGKLDNSTVCENEQAKFTVKIGGGKPKPSVKWFKEDQEINTSLVDLYEINETENSNTLIIKSVKPENAGHYYAKLVNETGSVNSNKAQLTVKSFPVIVNKIDELIVNTDE